MNYQALARQWRPRRFADVCGQQPVVQTLRHLLTHQHLHHALLFAGIRGTGKTTLARLYAKALNCQQGISSEPCNECDHCHSIDQGRFADLIEVDAASRTGVDDTRELLDDTQYAPSQGRFKVYLIDEVHMFSKSSFNALLKTLEEPPDYVQFLLATTDVQKLPMTILSRCLQFQCRPIPQNIISQQLTRIVKHETIDAEPQALAMIAQHSGGAMRDALTLLDQAIAFGNYQTVSSEAVSQLLGSIDPISQQQLLLDLAQRQPVFFERIQTIHQQSPDYDLLLQELLSALQQAIYQGITQPDQEGLHQQLSLSTLQLFYQLLLTARRDLVWAPSERAAFDMAMLRLWQFRPLGLSFTSTPGQRPSMNRADQANNAAPAAISAKKISKTDLSALPANVASPTIPSNQQPPLPNDGHGWHSLLGQLPLKGLTKQFALHTVWDKRQKNTFHLHIAPEHQQLCNRQTLPALEKLVQNHLGDQFTLSCKAANHQQTPLAVEKPQQATQDLPQAKQPLDHDPHLQQLQQAFDAQLEPDSVDTHQPKTENK